MRYALVTLLLLAPGLAAAQEELRSAPNDPAVSSRTPPSSIPGEAGGPQGGANRGASTPGRQPDDAARTAPPPGHRTLGGPPVPGATQPQSSGGFGSPGDSMPPRVGGGPDASTTGR